MALGTVSSVPGSMGYPVPAQKAAQAGAFGVETLFWEKLGAVRKQAQAQKQEEEASDTEAEEKAVFDYHEFFQDKINEIYVKVKSGDTEPSFQIGAISFTEKEWNKFLEEFDAIQDAIRELMREEQEKKEAERLKKELLAGAVESSLLVAESTSCVYPAENAGQEDTRYLTWYTKDGIFCRKMGQADGYEWSVTFDDDGQYDRVMELIGKFPSDWNLRFAAHKNFWTDFLEGRLDTEGFLEFMKGTNQGVPDYLVTVDGSLHVDREKMQWAKYLNKPGNEFYTAEEFQKKFKAEVAANAARLHAWELQQKRKGMI
ncbi:MAG: hypothetical protein K2N87_19115 [Eubacterium sp.]|nr:hypothetical protein [Eubacterium sp.]